MSGFPGQLSGGDLTNMRGDYQGRTFLLATPENIVFQALLPALSGEYAVIAYGAVQQGAFGDVVADMVYTITTGTTDFNNPTIRGYIREDAADATNIDIDVQDDTLTSGFYITVFEDYDIFPRKPRRALDINHIDYNKSFEKLPPTIGDIQSVYVIDTTDASDTIVFTPTTTAMSEGTSISSHLWDVGDGTITVGTSTDKDITASFPAGHRWVTFSTTDDNGITHTLHFEVYVGDLVSAAFTLHGAETIQWSGDFDGWSGSAPMFADVDNIVDNQRLTVCILDTPGPINTNIALIGRYRRENTRVDGGDSTSRNMQESDLVIEGFGPSLANIPVAKFNVTDKANPTVWNDIIEPSPVRVAWHVLTRYTTAANIMSFDSLTADLVYTSGAIAVSSQGCRDAINQVLARQNSQCNFSADGTLRIRRDTNFLDNRSGLTIIAEITTQDIQNSQLSIEYNDVVGQVIGGGLLYDIDKQDYVFLIAKAPTIISTIGEEIQQLNNQILDSTDTQNDASTDLQDRTAAKLAQVRAVIQLSLDLFDSFRFIEPSNYDRYNIDFPASLNLRGRVLDDTLFWQLRSISCSADVKKGTVATRPVFVQETFAGTAGRVVTIVPLASDVEIPVYPVMQPYSGQFNVDGSLFYPNDLGVNDWGVSPDSYQATEPKDGNARKGFFLPQQGIYTLYFADPSGVTTAFNTVAGETYQIWLQGDAAIETGSELLIEMLNGNGQGISIPYGGALLGEPTDSPAIGAGNYQASNDRYLSTPSSIGGRCSNIELPFGVLYPGSFVERITVDWVAVRLAGSTVGDKNCGITIGETLLSGPSFDSGTYSSPRTKSRTRIEGVDYASDIVTDSVLIHGSIDRTGAQGNTFIERVNLTLRNVNGIRGDAFYREYNTEEGVPVAYAASNGFLLNGSIPSPVPIYNSSHVYSFFVTGTGSPFTFQYGDTTSYGDNDWAPLTVTIAGPFAR